MGTQGKDFIGISLRDKKKIIINDYLCLRKRIEIVETDKGVLP